MPACTRLGSRCAELVLSALSLCDLQPLQSQRELEVRGAERGRSDGGGLYHQRRDQRKLAPLEPLESEPEHPDPGPLERAEDAEAAAFVAAFLAGLDDKKRDLFILAVLEEMTIPEVATALAIPLNTAYTRLRSVRADFERALGRRRS